MGVRHRRVSRCSSCSLLLESVLLVLAGRGREAEALVHMRTYQEEVAEALEATGACRHEGRRRDRDPVPAGARRPDDRAEPHRGRPGQCADLGKPAAGRAVLPVLRRRHLCRGRARRARADRRLRVLGPAVLEFPRPDRVGAVVELRAGRGAAVPADGRGAAARRPVRAPLPRAQCLARPAARRLAAHQHRGLRRVLGDLRLLGRDRRHHGLGRAAVLPRHALRHQDGARLARRRRRARQPHPARHHLHHLCADHRDVGERALSCGGGPEHPCRRAVHPGDPVQGAHRRAGRRDAPENPAAREAQDHRRSACRPRS